MHHLLAYLTYARYWGRGPADERWDVVATSIAASLHVECPRWLLVVEGVGNCMDDERTVAATGNCNDFSAAGQDQSLPTW